MPNNNPLCSSLITFIYHIYNDWNNQLEKILVTPNILNVLICEIQFSLLIESKIIRIF